MVFDNIYNDFVVRKAEIEESGTRSNFVCELESWNNHKVNFSLTIEGCVGARDYQAQHNAIEPYFKVGAILHCSIVYRLRSNAFVMCIDEVLPMRAINHRFGTPIDADSYFNRNRGFWARLETVGEWVKIPGVIELSGCSHIPIVEDRPLTLVEHSYDYERGLVYGKRPTLLGRLWRLVFA